MKRILCTFVSFLVAAVVVAQPGVLPRYKVVPHSGAKNAAERWNAAADQGYRFLFEGRLAVMALDARPPDTYRY
jgi:hypothetical protein